MEEIVREQAADLECQEAAHRVGHLHHAPPIKTMKTSNGQDKSTEPFKSYLCHITHRHLIPVSLPHTSNLHQGETHVPHDATTFYWLQIGNSVYATVRKCNSLADSANGPQVLHE